MVSDAGTPGVSDPGARVVAAVRAAGLPVVPIPGANAAIAAVSAAGLAAERFLFLGFLPQAARARRALLESVAALPSCALVCYEAPHRVRATVADLLGICGGTRMFVLSRVLCPEVRFRTVVASEFVLMFVGGEADDIERALLGRPASMRRSEISQDVEVTPGSARRFWHALGFQIVEDEEAMFTEADREALQAVARLTHDLDVEEELALAMTRALARTADRLAVWQTQLMAEYVTAVSYTHLTLPTSDLV